jgi:hypothetical protein
MKIGLMNNNYLESGVVVSERRVMGEGASIVQINEHASNVRTTPYDAGRRA